MLKANRRGCSSNTSGRKSARSRFSKSRAWSALAAAVASVVGVRAGHATSASWIAGPTNANWSAGANWGGTAPGATNTTTNTDTAFFTNTLTTVNGTASNPVIIDANRNIGSIRLDQLPATTAFVIGTTTGPALLLSAGGTIYNHIANTETINAPLIFEGTSYTINSSNSGGHLTFGGTLTGATTGGTTITITGDNNNNGATGVQFNGVISNGSSTSSLSISQSNSGITFNAINTYTGSTTLTEAAGTSGMNISATGAIGAGVNGGTAINLSGGSVFVDSSTVAGGGIQGTSSLTIGGTVTVTLSNSNSYTGGTTLNAGTLNIGNIGSLGSGTITLAGGTLSATTDLSAGIINAVAVTGAVGIGGANNLKLSGNITNTGVNGTITLLNTGSTTLSGHLYLSESRTGRQLVINSNTANTPLVLSATIADSAGGTATSGTSTLVIQPNIAGDTFLITGNNSYTGVTSLGGAALGTIIISSATAFGTSQVNLDETQIQTTSNLTLTNNFEIIHNGPENFIGSNNLTISGTFTNINTGTVSNIGTGVLTFSNTSPTAFVLTNTAGDTVTLGGSGAININGPITSGAGGTTVFTYAGTGTLTLTGSSSYTGSTLISSGIVNINADAALGAAATPLTINGGTLQNAGTLSLNSSRGITLGASGGTFDTPGAGDLTVNGIISGTGNLTKTSSARLILANTNTFVGNITIGGGIINVSGAVNPGDLAFGNAGNDIFFTGSGAIQDSNSNTTVTLNANRLITISSGVTASFGFLNGTLDTITIAGVVTGPGNMAVTTNGSAVGTLVLTNTNTYTGTTTISAGTLQISSAGQLGSGVYSNTISDNGIFQYSSSAPQTLSGLISGTGKLTKDGSGVLTLPNSNSFSGGTSMSAGTLSIGNVASLGSSTLTLGAGTITATSDLSAGITNAVAITASSTIGGTNNINFSGNVTNTGGNPLISFNDTATATFSGNIYLSESRGTARTLEFTSGISNTHLVLSGTIADSAAGNGTNGGSTLIIQPNGTGDTVLISGTNTYTGITSLQGGGVGLTTFTNASAFGTSAVQLSHAQFAAGAAGITLTNAFSNVSSTATFSGSNGLTIGGTFTEAVTGGLNNTSNGTLTFSNTTAAAFALSNTAAAITTTIGGSSPIIINGPISNGTGTGALTYGGTSTLTLAGSSGYTGATTISTGTVNLTGSIAAGSTVSIGTAGTLSGAGTVYGAATLTGGGIINLTNPGVIVGTLGVTGGNWNGAGSVSGVATVSSGTFTIGPSGSLTATGGLTVSGAGVLAGGGLSSTLTGNLSYTSSSNSTFGGIITGSGKTLTLNSSPAATLTLSGSSNSYTGATTITAGTLVMSGNNSSLTGAIGIAANGTLVLSGSNASNLGTITDSGGIVQLQANAGNTSGGNSTVLGNTTGNQFTGSNQFWSLGNNSTLQLRSDSTVTYTGTNGIGALNTSTLNINVDQLTSAGTNNVLTAMPNGSGFGHAVTINITGGHGYSLSLGQFGSVAAAGTLTLVPTSANVSVAGFTSNLNGVSNSLVLDGTAPGNTMGAVSDGTGTATTSLTKQNTSTWTLAGTNTYSGATSITGGTLILTGSTGAASTVTVSGTGILTGTGTVGGALIVNSGGTVNPGAVSGVGTLSVGGGVTFNSGSTFGVNLVNDSMDLLAVTGGATLGGTLSLSFSGTQTPNSTYVLITTTTGFGGSNFSNTSLFPAGYHLALDNTGDMLELVQSSIPTVAYWNGSQSSVWSYSGFNTNWQTAATGNTDTGAAPASTTDVYETANSFNNSTQTLGGDTTINSLTFTSTTTSGITINAGNTLTIVAAAGANAAGTGIVVQSGSGANTINTPIVLGGSQSWTNNGTGTLTLGGAVNNAGYLLTTAGSGNITIGGGISGTGGLTASSSGTLTLTGSNTYTGLTTITAGTLQIGGSGYLGGGIYAGNIGIANGALLQYSSNAAQTLSGIISGSGALTISGSGAITLSGPNTYTGVTTINPGTSGSTVGGTVVVNGNQSAANGGWNITSGNSSTNETVILSAGSTVNVASGNTFQIGGTVATGGGDTVSVAGTVTDSGVLNVQRGAAFTIQSGGNWTQSGAMLVASPFGSGGGNNMTVASGGQFTYNNPSTSLIQMPSGPSGNNAGGNLTIAGTFTTNQGFINSSPANGTASSSITLNGGTLALTANVPALLTTSGGGYTFNLSSGGGTINTNAFAVGMSGAISGANTGILTKAGSGALTLTASNTYTGGTTISAGTLEIGGLGSLGPANVYAGAVSNSSVLLYSSSANQTLSGIVSGTGVLNFTGAGTLTVSGLNTYTGNTTIGAGTLQVGGSGYLGGGVYTANIANNGTLRYSSSANQTLSGVISGSGALTKDTGGGTLTVIATNTYTGNTTISAGTLQLNTVGGVTPGQPGVLTGTPSIIVNSGGTLALNASDALGYTVGKEALTINGGIVTNITAAGRATIANTLTMTGGTLTGTGAGDSGGQYSFLGAGITATSDSGGNAATISAKISGEGQNIPFNVARGTATPASDLTVSGAIVPYNGETFGITKTGNGILTLTGSNTYTGVTAINGGTLNINADAALGAVPASALPANITINGGTLQDTTGNIAVNGNRGITLGSSGGTLDVTTGDLTINSIIAGTGSLTKTSGGRLILANTSSTFVGTVFINAGTVNINPGDAVLGNVNNDIEFTGNGFLQETSGNVAPIITLNAARTITLDSGVTGTIQSTLASGNTININGNIVGAGSFAVTGVGVANTVVLAGSNTYAGATTVTSATLQFSAANQLGNAGVSNQIFLAGSGVLDYTGSGTTTLSTNQTVSLTGSNAVLQADSGTLTVPGTVTNGGNLLTLNANGGNINISGAIGGTGGLNALGSGIVNLSAVNTYSGPTTINGPTLQISSAGQLNSGVYAGTIAISNTGLLQYSSTANQTLSGIISGTGAVTKDTSSGSTLTLSGSNTFTGTLTINAGTVTAAKGTNLATTSSLGAATNAISIASGATLNITDSVTGFYWAGTISGAGTINQNDSNSIGVRLGGNNSGFTGTYQQQTTTRFLMWDAANSGSASATWVLNASTNSGTSGIFAAAEYGTGSSITPGFATATSNTISLGALSGTSTVIYLGNFSGTASLSGNTTFSVGALNTSTSFAGNIVNQVPGSQAFTGSTVNLTKVGSGSLTLFGSNTYTGTTTVSAGTLALGNGGSLGNTAITVSPSATFAVTPSAAVTTSVLGSLTLGSGSAYTMSDGSASTLSLGGALTLTGGGGATLTFDLISNGSTLIDAIVAGGAITGTAGESIVINPFGSSAPTAGNYTFLSGSSFTASGLTLKANAVSFNGISYVISLGGNGTSEWLTVSGTTGASSAYWNGSAGSVWNASTSNWSTTAGGGTAVTAVPSFLTDVYETANSALNLTQTLGANTTINSLTFTGTGTSNTAGTTISAGNTLTITGAGINNSSGGPALGVGIVVNSGSGPDTINAPITLGGAQSWTNNSGSTLTVAGVASAGFGLTTAGSGAIVISGAITGNGNLTASGPGTLTLSAANALSGSSSLTLNGGTINLPQSNTYTGITNFNAATLILGNNAALGSTSQVSINGAAVLQSSVGNLVLPSNVPFNFGSNWTISGSNAITINGAFTNFGGNRTLTSSISGNALTLAGTVNLSNTTAAETFTINGTGNTTISGLIQNSASGGAAASGLTYSGSGTLTLTHADTYTDNTAISSGTLQLSGVGTLGSGVYAGNITNSGKLEYSSTVNQTLSGFISGNGAIVKDTGSSSTLTLSGSQTWSAAVTISAGTLALLPTTAASDIPTITTLSGAGNLTINNGQHTYTTFTGSMSGFSGTMTTTSSSIEFLGAQGAQGSTGAAFTFNLGTGSSIALGNDAGTYTVNLGSLSGNAPIYATAGGSGRTGTKTLSVGALASSTYDGSINDFVPGTGLQSSVALTKVGSGTTLTLTNSSTYTGATIINAGTLTLNGGNGDNNTLSTVGTGPITVNTGATLILTGTELGTRPGATLTINGTGVAKTLSTTGDNFISTLTLADGGSLQLAAGGFTTGGATTQIYDLLSIISTGAGATTNSITGGGITPRGLLTISVANGTLASDLTISAFIQDDTSGSASLTKTGAGTLTLSGSNTYSGLTTISGGTIMISGASPLGDGTVNNNISMAGGTTLDATGTVTLGAGAGQDITTTGAATIQGDSGTFTLIGNITNGNNNLIVQGAGAVVINGNIGAGSGALTYSGSNVLTLGGTNTYTGGTNITSGTVSVSAPSNFPTTGTVAISNGGTANINSTLGSNATATYGTIFSGAGTILLTLGSSGGSSNTYLQGASTGFTGTLELAPNGSVGNKLSTGGLNISSSALIQIDSGATMIVISSLANNISVTGTGNSENFGAIRLSSGGILSGTISLTGSATFGPNNGTITGPIQSGASGTQILTIGTPNASVSTTWGSVIGGGIGTLGLTIAGTGTQTLTGSNTYTGATTISSGTLQIGGSGYLRGGSYAGTISNSGTLLYSSSANQTLGGVISGSGALKMSGSGTLTLSAVNTLTGAVTVNSGTLTTTTAANSGSDGLGTSTSIVINSGGTVLAAGGDNSLTAGGLVPITVNAGGILNSASSGFTNNLGGTLTLAGGTLAGPGSPSGTGLTFGVWNLHGGVVAGGVTTTSTISAVNIALSATGGTTFNVSSGATSGIDLDVTGTFTHTASGGDTGLIKTGNGVMRLDGSNTYTGATSVTGGTLKLANGASLGATAVSVTGGTFAVIPGVSTTTTLGGSLTLNAGAVLTMADSAISTFSIGGSSTFAPASGVAATSLVFDLNGTTSDRISVTGAATAGTAGAQISVTDLTPTSISSSYTLITGGAGSALNSNFSLAPGSGVIHINGVAYVLSLSSSTATSEILTDTVSTLTSAYWTGNKGSLWNTPTSAPTNWSSDPAGASDLNAIPSKETDVYFSAATSSNFGTSLGANLTINTLNFTSNSSAVTIASGNTLTINANLSGSSLTSGINVASGSAAHTINANIALGSAQTWTNGNATGGNALTVGGNVANNGFTLSTGGTGDINISGNITGSGGVTQASIGVLTLSGSDSFTGATTITSGTLRVGSNSAISSSSAISIGASGTLDLNGNYLVTIPSLATSTGLITNTAAGTIGTLSIASTTGNGTLIKDGAGAVAIMILANADGGANGATSNNSNTYSGGLSLVGSSSSPNASFVRLIPGGTVTGSAGAITAGPYGKGTISIGLSTADRSQIWFDGNNTLVNALLVNSDMGTDKAGAIRVDFGGNVLSGALALGLSGVTFQSINSAGTLTINGAISSTGAAPSTGLTIGATTGTLTTTIVLGSSANTYSGNTTINANGIVSLNAFGAIPNGSGNGSLIVNGTLNLNGNSAGGNNLQGSGTIDGVSGAPILYVTELTSTTFSGTITDTAGGLNLNVSGTGTTLTLTGNNSFSNGLTLVAGTVSGSGSSTAFGSGTILLDGGSGSVNLNVTGATALTIANPISVKASSNQLTITDAATGGVNDIFSGGVTTPSGTGNLNIVNNSAAGGTMTFSGNGVNNAGSITYSGSSSGPTIFSSVGSSVTSVVQTSTTSTLTVGTLNVNGGLGGTTLTDSSAAKPLNVGTITGSGNLILQNNSATTNGINITGSVNFGGNLTNSGSGTGSLTISGVIGAAVVNVTQNPVSNSQVLTLSGANLYTGVTTISGGTLSTGTAGTLANGGSASSIGASTNVASNLILDGGTLQYASTLVASTGPATSTDRLFTVTSNGAAIDGSGSNAISFTNPGTLLFSSSSSTQTVTFTGSTVGNAFNPIIANNGPGTGNTTSVAKSGAGSWTLSGTNTFTGNVTISAGTLVDANAKGLGLSNTTTVVSGAELDLSGNITTNSSESLIINGPGVTGNTFGALQNASGTNTWTGSVTVASANTRIGASAGVMTVSGRISDGGLGVLFRSDDNGTVILTGSNTFSGPINITIGTLVVSSLNYVSSGSWANHATQSNLGDPSSPTNGIINIGSAGGSSTQLTYVGAGETTDRVINLFQGPSTITIDQSGSGALEFTNGVTATSSSGVHSLILQGSTASSGRIDGPILDGTATNSTSLTKQGTGTWILAGSSTYTGVTTVNGGTLTVSSTGGITSSVVVTGVGSVANINGGWLVNSGATSIGPFAGGTLNFNGTATIGGADTSQIGSHGTTAGNSNFNVTGGSLTFNYTDNHGVGLGDTAGGTGFMNISGGIVTTTLADVFLVGQLASATGSLTVGGSGTLSLGSAGLVIGNTTSAYGVVNLNTGGTISSAGSIRTNGGTSIINLNGGTLTSTAINPTFMTGLTAANVQSTSIINNGGFAITIGQALLAGGTGGLTFQGTGTTTLSNSNSYTGTTTVSTGTLVLSGNNTALTGAINVSSVGTLILSGSNASNLGNITVSGGILQLQNATALSSTSGNFTSNSGSLNLNSNATVNLRSDTAVTFTGTSGIGGLNGTSLNINVDQLTSAGTNNQLSFMPNGTDFGTSVTVNITGGHGYSLSLGQFGSVSGAGTLTLKPTSASVAVAGFTSNLSGLNNSLVLDGTAAGNTMGVISNGTGTATTSLTKQNTGTWTLTGSNTYTGTTSITAGTLSLGGSIAAGSTVGIGTSGTLTGGGTVKGNATLTGSGVINLSSLGMIVGTLSVTGGNWNGTGSVTGAVSSTSGTFNIGSVGNLTESSGLSVSGGSLTGLGTVTGNVTLTSSAIISLTTPAKITGTLGVTGGIWNGTGTVGGLVTDSSGTLTIGSSGNLTASAGLVVSGSGVIASGGTASTITGSVNYTSSSSSTFGGVIAGTGNSLTLNSASVTLTLTGTNTYTGNTTLSAGTLLIGSGGRLGAGAYAGAIADNGSLQYLSSANQVLSGNISGSGSLLKGGSATSTLTLSASNTYTGGTTVSAGTLVINNNVGSGTGSGSVGVSGTLTGTGTFSGALTLNSGGTVNPGTVGGVGTLHAGGGATFNATSTFGVDLSGNNADLLAVTGSAALGGTLSLNISGSQTLSSYELLSASSISGAFSSYSGVPSGYHVVVVTAGAPQVDLIQNVTPNPAYWSGSQSSVWNTIAGGNSSTNWIDGPAGNETFATPGSVTDVYETANTAANLTQALGANTTINSLTFTSTNTSGVTINAGNTLTINAGSGTGITVQSGSGANTLNASVALGGAQTWTNNGGLLAVGAVNNSGNLLTTAGSGNFTINGILSGSGGLTAAGSGTVTLGAANTFTGNVNVNTGTVSVGSVASGAAAQPLGEGGTINLGVASVSSGMLLYTGAGGTLDKTINALGNGSDTIQNAGSGPLTLSGSLVKNGTHLNLAAGTGGITVSGVISGSMAGSDLNLLTGITVLTASNTYVGATNISSGATLQLGDGANGHDGSIFSTSGVSNSGALTYNLYSAQTAPYPISGSGTVTKTGGGKLTVSGSNTYTGNTTVNGGILAVAGSLGSTTVNIESTASLAGAAGQTGSNGEIGGTVNVMAGAKLAPGAGLAATVAGHLNLDHGGTFADSTSQFVVRLDASQQSGTPTYDHVIFGLAGAGTMDLGSATLVIDDSQYYDNYNVNGALPGGDQFWILTGVGSNNSISGAYASAGASDVFGTNGVLYRLTYNAPGTAGALADPYNAPGSTLSTVGGDFVLTVVPEPTSLGLLGLGAVGLLSRRRRKMKSSSQSPTA